MSFGYDLPSESTFLISSSEYVSRCRKSWVTSYKPFTDNRFIQLGYYKLDANVTAIHQFLFYRAIVSLITFTLHTD